MKGISQVIAAALLLAVSVSVAGVYANWAPELSEAMAGEVTDQTDSQITCRNADFFVRDVDYVGFDNRLDVTIDNTGTIAFRDGINIAALADSSIVAEETLQELEVDEERTVELRLEEEPEQVAISSNDCPGLNRVEDNVS